MKKSMNSLTSQATMDLKRLQETGVVYDATSVSRILGIPVECNVRSPQAADGEIVIYYGGWDWKALCAAGKQSIARYDRDRDISFDHGEEPGYYRLLLPVPNSIQLCGIRQLCQLVMIDKAWQPSPAIIAATALLVHLMETGNDLLRGYRCRCAHLPHPHDGHAVLWAFGHHVQVYQSRDTFPFPGMWSSAARKADTSKS